MSITVVLDSVDISTLIMPDVTVSREERSAKLAQFTYKPATSPLLPAQMVRKSVTIDWDGERIFTGAVNKAFWDLKTRTFRIECSDFLQERFEGKTDAQILALIPGSYYSTAVFGEKEDGWQYALDLMSTVQKDVHLNRNDILVTPAWTAKTTPDITLTEGEILNNGAYALDLSKARDIITRLVINVDYRFNRWKKRNHSFNWSYNVGGTPDKADDWCDWAQNWGFDMPTREIIRGAAEGTGWDFQGINFTTHPDTGIYCGGIINWVITAEAQAAVVIAASWNGTRHWGQTVTEKYEITLNVPARQADMGIVVHEDSVSRQIEADDASFEANRLATSFSGSTDPIGDIYEDQDDEVARLADLNTIIAIGVTKLWEGLRQNTVTIETAILPTLELSETVQINTSDINAKGKVSRIEHTITMGACTTRITLAIMAGGNGVSDSITVPSRPNTLPSYAAPPSSTVVGTYIGGCGNSPNYDPSWHGWTTNMSPTVCQGGAPTPEQIYPLRFSIPGPDIEDEARDAVEALSQVSFNVGIPNDTLTLL